MLWLINMLKFIWNSWWRNKERFILLLVGVLILSTGLSYLIGITQANNGTVVDELQKRWKASYHLVVRPDGSRSVTEELNLLEPNYLSGMDGGISLDQYKIIKEISDVEIAAPIAMIGSIKTDISLDSIAVQEPGVYRHVILEKTNTGAGIEEFGGNTYSTVGEWRPEGLGKEYGASPINRDLTYGSEVMVAGIDPEAEAKLVGINQAIVEGDSSRFFHSEDVVKEGEENSLEIPAIISNIDYVDANITYLVEKLEFPFQYQSQMELMERIKENGGEAYLETLDGEEIEKYRYTTKDVHNQLIAEILESGGISTYDDFTWMAFKPSPLNYSPVTSPFGKRWPFSYQVQPYEVPKDSLLAVRNMYRPVNMFSKTSQKWPRLKINYIGVYDPKKLNVSKDPLTELPMETYFPAKAQWVMDADNQPVNPPTDMNPLNNPYGFLTKPPMILTTLEAAAAVLGEKPISAIRINVAGVNELNEESEAKLQAVAKEIEEKTGLITDVTLGSSPQLALTYLPGLEGAEALGWVQQPWIKLGSSISIFQESKMGMSGVIASVILVAIVYVFTSNIIMLFARKKEFAVLLSLGWRPSQLAKMLFLESTILGLIVALISWLILGAFFVAGDINTSLFRVSLIGISGLIIYWFGSIMPINLARKIRPYESIRTGEISHKMSRFVRAESVIGMSINHLFTQWKRSLLSILAISVPTSLFIFFLFVTVRLKGVLYATWLGEFVALEVGTMHYVAMGVALLIAILTTTEIIWQNVSERQAQIAVLKAMGWHNNNVRLLVLLEGLVTGLLAGVVGLTGAIGIIFYMYGDLPTSEFGFLVFTIIIPIITGIVGSILPANKAARILPFQAINGAVQNSKKVERQFKWVLSIVGVGMFVGILSLLIFAIPENTNVPTGKALESSTEGTKGNLLPTTSVKTENKQNEVKEEVVDSHSEVENLSILKENAWRVLSLGESTGDGTNAPDLTFGKLTEVPTGLKVSSDENKLISIPVTIIEKGNGPPEGHIIYKPHGYYLKDESGNKYKVTDMKKINVGDWNKQPSIYKLFLPGEVSVVLTYEVPKNHGDLVMIANGSYTGGDVVVEIK